MIASFRNRTRLRALLFGLVAVVAVVGLTDAASGGGVPHWVSKDLDPATMATAEKLHQKISIDLTNATFTEVLSAVANQAGVPVTQSPDIATSDVQNARFTIKAEQVPAHLVLMETLAPFKLAPKPGASSVEISEGGMHFRMLHHGHPGEAGEEDVLIVTNGDKVEAERVIKVLEGKDAHEAMILAAGEADHADGKHRIMIRKEKKQEGDAAATEADEVHKRVFVRKMATDAAKADADGKIRRELTLNFDENGVKSEGKLSIEITK